MRAAQAEIKIPTYAEFMADRAKFRWHGKPLKELNRDELEDALVELNGLYTSAVQHIGQTRRVQFVPLQVAEGSTWRRASDFQGWVLTAANVVIGVCILALVFR